jgi:hypothetical protein
MYLGNDLGYFGKWPFKFVSKSMSNILMHIRQMWETMAMAQMKELILNEACDIGITYHDMTS